MITPRSRSLRILLVVVFGWSLLSTAAPPRRNAGTRPYGHAITEGLPELLECLPGIVLPLEMADQPAAVERSRPLAENAARNLFEFHDSMQLTRDRLLAIPLGQRQAELEPWLLFWDQEIPLIIKKYDILNTQNENVRSLNKSSNPKRPIPFYLPDWLGVLMDSLARLRWRESHKYHRFLEYSDQMRIEYDGADAGEEQAALPEAQVDVIDLLRNMQLNSTLNPLDVAEYRYRLRLYLQSLATLAKHYLKVADYDSARRVLLLSHLTNAQDVLDKKSLLAVTQLDDILAIQQQKNQALAKSILDYFGLGEGARSRPGVDTTPYAFDLRFNRVPQFDPSQIPWAKSTQEKVAALNALQSRERLYIILIDSLAELYQKQGDLQRAIALLTDLVESPLVRGAAPNAAAAVRPVAPRAGAVNGLPRAGAGPQAGDPNKAVAFIRASGIFMNHALLKLAKLYQATGQMAQAEERFGKARERFGIEDVPDPADPNARPPAGQKPGVQVGAVNIAQQTKVVRGRAELQDVPTRDRFLLALRGELCEDTDFKRIAEADLASFYADMSRFDEAERLYKKCIDERGALLGYRHPDVAGLARGLANVYFLTGRYSEAQKYLQTCVAVYQAERGPYHPETASISAELGAFFQKTGQITSAQSQLALAKRYLDRAFGIYERSRLFPTHPDRLVCLAQCAELYLTIGKAIDAAPLLQRLEAVLKTRVGQENKLVDPLESVMCWRTIGKLYLAMGKEKQAVKYLEDAEEFAVKMLKTDHPREVAACYFDLAEAELAAKHPEKAREWVEKCLTLRERVLDPGHLDLGKGYMLLSHIEGAVGHRVASYEAIDRARRALRRFAARTLPTYDENAQIQFLKNFDLLRPFRELDMGRKAPGDVRLQQLCAGWVINGKAIALDALSEQSLVSREGPATGPAAELKQVRNALSGLAHFQVLGRRNVLSQIQQIESLTNRERQLVREVGESRGTLAKADPWVDVDAVRKRLPPGAVVIELIRLEFRRKNESHVPDPPAYVAWVIPQQPDTPIRVVDLGPAIPIDQAIDAARTAIATDWKLPNLSEPEKQERTFQKLRVVSQLVLEPLRVHASASKQWYVSPDAKLWLIPWAALPLANGRYLVEEHEVSYLVTGRDLDRAPAQEIQNGRSLVMADPDYDMPLGADAAPRQSRQAKAGSRRRAGGPAAKPKEKAPPVAKRAVAATLDGAGPGAPKAPKEDDPPIDVRTEVKDELRVATGRRAPRLPGTAREAKQVASCLALYLGADPDVLTGVRALESSFKAVRNPRVVVLSTHGFALGGSVKSNKKPWVTDNPLLSCGVLLAGYNQGGLHPQADGADGVLTGMEIVGTDLRGTELVVLSACETGLGLVRSGEGVASLRQAFQLAGAQAVVATLWQVDDLESARLMARFFENLADGKSKAESLRAAQLSLIELRRTRLGGAHPFYWASFTLTGLDPTPRAPRRG
jgi:CHAT domain-containing protein